MSNKLLIITQTIDGRDKVLGFMVDWLKYWAKNLAPVMVICLELDRAVSIPGVEIRTLGKETGASRIKYIKRLFRHLWQENNNYTRVLVHMNQEYVLLAGWWWRLTGKKIWFWYNHRRGNLLTRLAVMMANRVFCTSPDSYTAKFPKTILMPAGIDTELFKPMSDQTKPGNRLLYLGRLSPVKQLDLLIEAVFILDEEGVDFILDIVGDPPPGEETYARIIKNKAQGLIAKGKVNFLPGVNHRDTVFVYNQHYLLINLTPSGSLDKVILEAMACRTMILTANRALRPFLSELFLLSRDLPIKVAEQVRKILSLTPVEIEQYGQEFRQFVIERHSLFKLTQRLKELS